MICVIEILTFIGYNLNLAVMTVLCRPSFSIPSRKEQLCIINSELTIFSTEE